MASLTEAGRLCQRLAISCRSESAELSLAFFASLVQTLVQTGAGDDITSCLSGLRTSALGLWIWGSRVQVPLATLVIILARFFYRTVGALFKCRLMPAKIGR